MSKKQTAIIILAILVVFGVSCKQKEPGRYYNKKHSFSIKFPAGWEINEGDMKTVVLAIKTDLTQNDIFPENINVVTSELPGGMNLEAYLNMQVNGIKVILEKISDLEKGFIKIDKNDTAWVSYIYKIGDITFIAKSYFIIVNKTVFTITFVADKEDYKKIVPVFEDTVKSFRLE
jgi:hypothetical protein